MAPLGFTTIVSILIDVCDSRGWDLQMLLVEPQHWYRTVPVHLIHADFRIFPVLPVNVYGQLSDMVALYRLNLMDLVVPDLCLWHISLGRLRHFKRVHVEPRVVRRRQFRRRALTFLADVLFGCR